MNLPPHLLRFHENPLPVLSHGHVQLIDVMGDDNAIADAARVSYGGKAEQFTHAQNKHLVRYLLRHWHTTPFEMCEIKLRIRVPMDAWRQWIRHRTANVNEYSTRYKPAIEDKDVTDPTAWRLQATDNKQGSNGYLTEWPENLVQPSGEVYAPYGPIPANDPDASDIGRYLSHQEERLHTLAQEIYEERLALGVAKEQARKDLPLSTYTEAYWKIDLHNLFHFLRLRVDSHAQLEIRLYAEAIAQIVKEWVPVAWQAFEDYHLKSMTLTRFEVDALAQLIRMYGACVSDDPAQQETALVDEAIAASGLSPKGREAADLSKKIRLLLHS